MSGSALIRVLLERMGCLRKVLHFEGLSIHKKPNKTKKNYNTLSWFCFFHIIRFTFCIGCADVPSMRYDESLPFQCDLKYQGKKKYRSNLADMKQDPMPHHLWNPVTKHLEIIKVKKWPSISSGTRILQFSILCSFLSFPPFFSSSEYFS